MLSAVFYLLCKLEINPRWYTTRFVKCIAIGKPLTHATIAVEKWLSNVTMPAIEGQSELYFATNGALLYVGNKHIVNSFFTQELMRLQQA